MFKSHTLENGLTVIGEINQNAHSVAIGFFVKTGARDETPEVSGVSHFLEHMMFKGTAKRSALDVTYDLAAIGAQANAYTSEENTVYYASVLPEYFEDCFELLSDMLRPSLDEKEFSVEKNVILEEIALYQDRPTHILFERVLEEFFKGHLAGNSVLGTTESITALTQAQMKEYFDERYSPSNIVLSVCGNYDWDKLCEMAEKYCGSWKEFDAKRDTRAHTPVESSHVLHKENLQNAHLCFACLGPSAQDEDRYVTHVLNCILGDYTGSKAYWALVDKGLAESASIAQDDMDGTGLVYAYASSAPENLDQVAEVLKSIIENPLDFTDAELEQAKTKISTRLVLSGENTRRRMMGIGTDWLYRKDHRTLDQEVERVKAVDKGVIEEMLSRFDYGVKTIVRMLPKSP